MRFSALVLFAIASPAMAGAFTVTYDDPKCAVFETTLTASALALKCKDDGGGTPPAAPTCAPTAATVPTPMTSAGGSVNLNAACVPNTGVTYTWQRLAPSSGVPVNPNSPTPTDTLAPNSSAAAVAYTWQVVACLGGAAPSACDTKLAQTSVPGTPPQAWPPRCDGFTATRSLNMGWPISGSSFNTQALGGFGQNDALVLKITPPAGVVSQVNQAGSIAMAEYGDPLTGRYAVLSTVPCDFSGTGGPYTIPAKQVGSTISWSLQVGRKDSGAIIRLDAGRAYYLNVKNRAADGTTPTCYSGSCNMVINWLRPPTIAATKKKTAKK